MSFSKTRPRSAWGKRKDDERHRSQAVAGLPHRALAREAAIAEVEGFALPRRSFRVFHFEAVGRAAGARFSSAIFSSARKSERHQLAVESRWSQYIACRGELVEMERTRCDPRAKPRGKRPPSAQRWRRKQTIPSL